MQTQEQLLDRLKKDTRVLQDARVEQAFRAIDRADFVRDDYKVEAYEDYPLPIGEGQTISQPTVVAFMLEQLGVREGGIVLDVGCGSGWTTALLAHMIGGKGKVYGVERVLTLVEFGRENLKKYDFHNVEILEAQSELGLFQKAPFDRILVSASAPNKKMAEELLDQLKPGGALVIPIGDTIYRFTKDKNGGVRSKEFPGFAFVPLVS
ncbi:protein-L-isoaspartate(D-aspartate) O-methyltransferase [Candidatus Wolfebacteria bacterium]|nr:protein-L-isoaspartate(D-aspartate) O-methyltransferase [Candidatus Wolfebacteria bacterium]